MISMALIIVSILIIGIWVLIELRKFKHQLWAFILIALVLFGYISFTITTKGHDIDYASFSGIMEATSIYFSWLWGVVINCKSIVGHAIGLDWGPEAGIK